MLLGSERVRELKLGKMKGQPGVAEKFFGINPIEIGKDRDDHDKIPINHKGAPQSLVDVGTDGKGQGRKAILISEYGFGKSVLGWDKSLFLRNPTQVAVTDTPDFFCAGDSFRMSGIEVIFILYLVDVSSFYLVSQNPIRIISHKKISFIELHNM